MCVEPLSLCRDPARGSCLQALISINAVGASGGSDSSPLVFPLAGSVGVVISACFAVFCCGAARGHVTYQRCSCMEIGEKEEQRARMRCVIIKFDVLSLA